MNKIIIVGSGLFGLTIANLIVGNFQIPVKIIEQREHIGGNAWSHFDSETGIEIHNYGSHIFHTSNRKVIDFITKFAEFNSYKHTVWAKLDSQFYSMPFNLQTMSTAFSRGLSPDEAREILKTEIHESGITEEMSHKNLENRAIYLVGKTLYEKLIREYTEKQWQTNPADLPSSVINRIPVRFNFNNSYFTDSFQGIPIEGYNTLLRKMVEHELIEVDLGLDYFETEFFKFKENFLTIYSGPIDRFYDYSEGHLGWRTLDFEIQKLNINDFQGTSVVNYPSKQIPWTRIHEFKHFHPESEAKLEKTIIMKEFSRFATRADEPYYPINSTKDREILHRYRKKIEKESFVHFGGRLGSYQYLDMHMAIASAMNLFENAIGPKIKEELK